MIAPARQAAFDILLRVEKQDAYASELLHTPDVDRLSAADRALCTELTMGVLRWRLRLDNAIRDASSQKLQKLDPEVLTALRLAAYQIGFLERVPSHAAVNDSVELVKRARKRSAAPFVNAVLRKIVSHRDVFEPVLAPGMKTVLDLSQLYSHPLWLVERWAALWGIEIAEAICAYGQQTPATSIRLRDPEVEAELFRDGVQLGPGLLLTSARRLVAGDLTRTAAFREGRVAIQDEGSQLVSWLVGTGERLLDCCAAPGGKTAILADRNRSSQIIAADLHPHRASMMRDRLSCAQNVRVVAANATQLPISGSFDRVLADVPCSGTGTLARHPEIKWRLNPADLADLHARQVAILSSALDRLTPGGQLVYASCSLEPEECETVVDEVMQGENAASYYVCDIREELESLRQAGELAWSEMESIVRGRYLRTLPGVHPCDGFFAAVIRRTTA